MSAGIFVLLAEMRKPLTVGTDGMGAAAGEVGVAPLGVFCCWFGNAIS